MLINAYTFFFAISDGFKDLTKKIAGIIARQNPADVDALLECKEDGQTVAEMVQELFLSVRENIKIRRFERYEGIVSTYTHGGGRIGVMVKFDTTDAIASADSFKEAAKDVAMQIAAINPSYLDEASVPADVLEKEKAILTQQVIDEGKPEAIAQKIVMGKIGKFYKENCLMDQVFVKDGDYTVSKYLAKVAGDLGGEIKVLSFVRFEKGEGIQKREDNFADEVASMVK